MSDIKRRALLRAAGRSVAFVALALILLSGLSTLFYPKNNQSSFGMIDERANGILGERENSIDVVFIGDSEAYSAFSPLQMWNDYGFTSYVCATGGQNLPYGTTMLHRATQSQRPRVVVFETDSAYRPFSPHDAILRAVQDVFPIFEYHNRWKSLTTDDFTSTAVSTYTDGKKGFVPNANVKAADAKGHMAPSDKIQEVPVRSKLYLRKMIDYCRSIGATPLFVSTPSTVCWNAERHNGMAAFARELGVEYLDLNAAPTKVDIDWASDTHDAGDHLNLSGARKVSDFIARYLSQTYGLTDHRNDADYGSWSESYERYRDQIE